MHGKQVEILVKMDEINIEMKAIEKDMKEMKTKMNEMNTETKDMSDKKYLLMSIMSWVRNNGDADTPKISMHNSLSTPLT